MQNKLKTQEIEGFLVIYNSNRLIIINPEGVIVLSKDISVKQIRNNYIVVSENNLSGVYRYDGSLIFPIEFYFIFIEDNGFVVKKNKNETDSFIRYNKL